ncbi:hypothetical protein MYX64_07615 [Nitrospinae bacterium AH_259_B05_G02_I21]|nr:hypothetical protein [Nitrospinae bacterium AH_259_B05_G02_I21]
MLRMKASNMVTVAPSPGEVISQRGLPDPLAWSKSKFCALRSPSIHKRPVFLFIGQKAAVLRDSVNGDEVGRGFGEFVPTGRRSR